MKGKEAMEGKGKVKEMEKSRRIFFKAKKKERGLLVYLRSQTLTGGNLELPINLKHPKSGLNLRSQPH